MKVDIFGVKIDNLKEVEVVELVGQKLVSKEKFWIATPNPEMVVEAQKDKNFREILNSANLAIPDGQGLLWAAKFLRRGELLERVTGTDLMAKLCEQAAKRNWKVFFLGGAVGVAIKALDVFKKRFPGLEGQASEGPQELRITNYELRIDDPERDKEAKEKINQFTPDLLFVGFGMGKQERWLKENLNSLKIGGALVVGGAFDFYSGKIKRAPRWFREAGFEWLWRLACQPWRLRRQTNLLRFIWLVMRKRLEIRNRR